MARKEYNSPNIFNNIVIQGLYVNSGLTAKPANLS